MATKDEKRRIEIIADGKRAESTLKQMESAARELNAQLKKLPANSKEFADKSKELSQVKSRLTEIKNEVNGVGGVFGKVKQEIKAFGLIAMGALGFEFLTSQVRNLIAQNAKLSDSFADIRKTTGMTEQEVMTLNKAFSSIDTRTSTKDLRDIAIAAGQLGIAKEDILSFTDATDKLVVSLGDEFQGGAEQVTKEMGALRNIFADIKSDNVADDMLHIGNAVNQLASAGAATGPVVADFANRIGGVGINLGLTSGQVLGLSATLQELNVSTERGGTAISKILLKMTTDTDKFAKVAGVSTKEFTELVNKDLFKAFQLVSQGAKNGGASATEFGKILDDLGVDGAGASEVFSKLGANSKLLQEKVDLANVSLKNTDGIMNEFALKNDTLGAKVEKLGKTISSIFVSDTFNTWITDAIVGTQKFVNWLIKLPDAINRNRGLLIAMAGALIMYNRQLIVSKTLQIIDIALKRSGLITMISYDVATKKLSISQTFANVTTAIGNKAMAIGNGLKKAGAFVTGLFTGATWAQAGATTAATGATIGFKTALDALGIGLIINLIVGLVAVVTGLVGIIFKLNDYLYESGELLRDAFADEFIRRVNVEFGKTKGLMGDINKLTLEQIANREKDIDSRVALAKAQLQFAKDDKRIGAEQLELVKDNYLKTLDLKKQLYNRKAFLLQEELDAERNKHGISLGLSKEAEEKRKKLLQDALEEYKRLVAEYNEIEDRRFFDMLTKNDQELKAVNDKYAKLIEARKRFLNNPLATQEQKQVITQEINTLNNQQGDDNLKIVAKQHAQTKAFILDLEQKQTREMNTEYENRVLDIKSFYAKKRAEAIAQGDFEETQHAIERAEYNDLINAKADRAKVGEDRINELRHQRIVNNRQYEAQEYLAIIDKYSNEMALLRERYGDEYYLNEEFQAQAAELEKLSEEERADYILTQRKELQEQLKQLELDALKFGIDLMQQKLAAYYDMQIAHVNQVKERELKELDEEKARINGQVDTRSDAEKRIDAEKARIEKQAAVREHQIRVKAFRAEQAFAVGKIALDTAIAVAKLQGIAAVQLAAVVTAPLAANTYTQMGITIGAAALQSAAVLAQKPPKMGKGGILKGDKHSDASGGMPVINPSTGQVVAVVEDGEPVIAKNTAEANPDIIQALFNANGKRVNMGLFNQPTFADTGRLFNNVPSYGNGGVIGGAQQGNSVNVNADAMMQAVDKFTNAVNILVSSPIYAEVSFYDVKAKFEESRKAMKGTFPNRSSDGIVKDGNVYLNDNLLS